MTLVAVLVGLAVVETRLGAANVRRTRERIAQDAATLSVASGDRLRAIVAGGAA
jgi:hypothetical protein